LIIIVVLLVVGFFWFVGKLDGEEGEGEITCVPASCCHATECVLESEAPDCSGSFCTMECSPGTMDCGQGHCGVIDGECEVIWNE